MLLMSKVLVVLFLLIVVGVGVYVLYFAPAANANYGTLSIGSKDFHVEIADTEQKRARGLSGRTSIGSDGILFVFATPGTYKFWMIDMQFPLDFIWINNGAVVEVDAGIQPPKPGQDPKETQILPSAPANYVLEVPAGFANQYLVEVGTQVSISLPGQKPL